MSAGCGIMLLLYILTAVYTFVYICGIDNTFLSFVLKKKTHGNYAHCDDSIRVMDNGKYAANTGSLFRVVSNTAISYGLLMTHRAPGLSAFFQSPAVKEVLKDQDGRKGLIAAICAGKVYENKLWTTVVISPHPFA